MQHFYQEGVYQMCKRIIFLIGSFALCVSCLSKLNDSIDVLLNKYPFIQSIEERRGWNGSGGKFIDPLALDIKMEDNKRIFVSYIDSGQLKSPFVLNLINTSTFMFRYECEFTDTHWARTGIPSDYIAKALSIELDSVDDVIKNYESITKFVDSLTKLNDIIPDDQTVFIYDKDGVLSIRGWLKKTKPLVLRKDNYFEKLFILNIEGDKFPNFYTNQAIITKGHGEYGRLRERRND
jgi:hypothetical protein